MYYIFVYHQCDDPCKICMMIHKIDNIGTGTHPEWTYYNVCHFRQETLIADHAEVMILGCKSVEKKTKAQYYAFSYIFFLT